MPVFTGKLSIEEIKDDPDDNMVLACAVEGEADVIISGDHPLADAKTYKRA
ncbi:MAG: PIN domain-containing protein [Deltaproteobacteria bacterium]|nr:PIN domain-containing protein [Deltaproteobacteria bacterium]